VNHVARLQVAAGRDHRLARGQAAGKSRLADAPACGEDRGTAGAMDGAVHAAAAQEARVRGVHDRVHVLAREVPHLDRDAARMQCIVK
jgi:hypothetical protein